MSVVRGIVRRGAGLAVVIALAGTSCSSSSSRSQATVPAASTSTTTTLPDGEWRPGATGGVLELPGGGQLVVPAGAVDGDARFRVDTADPGTAAPPEMEPVLGPWSIDVVGGRLLDTVSLEADLPPLTEGAAYVAATWDGRMWQPVLAEYDPARGRFATQMEHFSIWGVFVWGIGELVTQAMQSVFGFVDTSELPCDAGPLTDGYGAWITDMGDAFSGCARIVDGRIVAEIKNRRYASFTIELADGFTATVQGAQEFSAFITERLFNLTSRRFVVIPGGSTVVIEGEVPPGGHVSMPVEQDMFSWAVDGIFFALSVFALGTRAAGDTATTAIKTAATGELLNEFSDLFNCVSSGWELGSDVVLPDLDRDIAGGITDTAVNCAKAAGGVASQILGTLIGLVTTPIILLWELFELAKDVGKDRDLMVTRADVTDGALPSEFHGVWAGTIVAGVSSVSDFPVVLTIGADGTTLELPRAGCTAPLTLTALDGSVASMDGTFVSGNCVEGGTWRLTLRSAHELYYEWLGPDGTRVDQGRLTRQGDATGGGPGESASWPEDAGLEGPSVLYVYFGADIYFPSWVSCTDDERVCVAGQGTEIRVYRVHPNLGLILVASTADDPMTVLSGAGLSPAEISQVLDAA